MTKTEHWTVGGLVVSFLFACVYGLTLLVVAAHWFDELLRQPSWVVIVGILAALYVPLRVLRSTRRLRNAWRRKFHNPHGERAGI